MNCEQATRIDLAGYLSGLGHSPAKVRGNNCWYHSPLHPDNTPSFKVDRVKNTWYDFSLGKGGTLVDFVCVLHGCDIAKALEKIESKEPNISISFPQQPRPELSEDNGIKILQVSGQFTDMVLRRYLNQRNIPKVIAEKFCRQVTYQTGDKRYSAIGFKNNAGGYELRSPDFKGSSSPKFISYLDNGANSVTVFEGFFDFLTYQSIHHNQEHNTSNFLVLNSLSFFRRSLLLMGKHERIHLYLDNDKTGKECTRQLQQRTERVTDESRLYYGYKDLNEWAVEFGESQKLSHSRGRHL